MQSPVAEGFLPAIPVEQEEREDITQHARQLLPEHGHVALSFLCEFLDTDLLPAFVVSVSSESVNAQHARFHHVNLALKAQSTVQAQIASCLSAINGSHRDGVQCQQLFDWMSSVQAASSRTRISTRTTLEFCEFRWTATLLGNQWAVVVAAERIQSKASKCGICDTVPRKGETPTQSLLHGSKNAVVSSATTADDPQTPYDLGRINSYGQLGDSDHLDWIRNFDWASTSLGSIETWSLQLRQACEMMLASPQPVALMWGDDYTVVFNKPYLPIYGEKYRKIMGRPLKENWPPAVYDRFASLLADTKLTGQPVQQNNQVRHFPHEGQLQEMYINMSMIPVLTPSSSVAGFYCHVTDITKQTVFERRTRLLTDVNDSLASSRSVKDVWSSVISALGDHKGDIHFVAIYARPDVIVLPSAAPQVILEAAAGIYDDHSQLVFDSCTATRTALGIAIQATLDTGSVETLSVSDGTLSEQQVARFTECGVVESCRDIVVFPLVANESGSVEAAVVIGVPPLRLFDDGYRSFLRLLRKQCESAITVVKLIENERALLHERAVAESQKKFIQFAEKAPVGIYMFDQEGSIKFCNKAYEEICDVTREGLEEAMAWTSVMHPDSLDETQMYWDRLVKLEGPFVFETQFKKPWTPANGAPESLDRTWGLASAYPDISDDGELRGIFGCVVDISYVKWAEKIQSERLSEALELKRQQDNFLDMTSHEIRNPLNAVSHCASELVEQLILRVDMTGTAGNQSAALDDCLHMANTILYCAKHQKRIIDDVLTLSKLDSRLLQICPAVTNPTELVTRILTLFESELRASEVKTSIDVLQGYRELGIVEVLLDPHRVSQVIINLLSNAVKFVQGEQHRFLRINIDASCTEPKRANEDLQYVPSSVHQQDPTETEEWGTGEVLFLTFSVQDTGPGMDDEQASLLFNKFSQASPRTHANYGGSGLGLFISRELTEMHGGRIGLSSRPGAGSTFSFYVKCRRNHSDKATESSESINMSLPVRLPTPLGQEPPARKMDVQTAPDDTPKDNPSSGEKFRVLIVEDNIINQRLLKKLVLKHGYEASVANHGEEALTAIQSSAWRVGTQSPRLDIVLCDIEMPVMDGKTCVRRIRQLQHEGILQPNIPVVAVTGNARAEQIQSAKESGFDSVICKPYEKRELLAMLVDILGS